MFKMPVEEEQGAPQDVRAQLLQQALQAALGQQAGPARAYRRPSEGEAAIRNRPHQDGGMGQALLRERQGKYAKRRLSQFQKIAALLGGDFQQAVEGQDMNDPLAAFKNLSGMFANASKERGVQDPRMLLQQLLMARQRGGAA